MSIQAAYIMPHPPVIVPEVGRGGEAKIQKTIGSFHAAAKQIADIKPETIIIISPHSVAYSDYIHISPGQQASGSLRNFGAPDIYNVRYDEELVSEICKICDKLGFPAGTSGEKNAELDHGVLVPLYFINQYYTDYNLIRCSVSGLPNPKHYHFGTLLNEAVESLGRKTVIIASGDLSHKLTHDGPYGFAPEGPELDRTLVDIMKSGNLGKFFEIDENLCEKGAECGLASFKIMAGALEKKSFQTQFYSYEGPLGVGYAVCGYEINENIYVRLARETLESYVSTGKIPELPENLPDHLTQERAGVFVSIKKHGELRGCIGTIEPTQTNIAREIQQNAISSGTRDPRFSFVEVSELPELVYSVDVLSPSEPCEKEDLHAKMYGVIVTSENGSKRGLLLPNLEGVDTVEEQINIACRKAGIRANEKYTLERFKVVRHT
jgi:AmmeMemoRadiSam system protein A/AmmeMemoRadiSam system protein B